MSDCRVQKRASASLSLRLPRGRPPAVGITNDFFNMTPPSAEAVTPTKDEPKPVITETVEGSIAVPAKEVSDVVNGVERTIPIDVEKPVSEPEKPATDAEKPAAEPEKVDEKSTSEEETIDKFVLAERPDYNPNPHS